LQVLGAAGARPRRHGPDASLDCPERLRRIPLHEALTPVPAKVGQRSLQVGNESLGRK
jgi:hypothetical protein